MIESASKYIIYELLKMSPGTKMASAADFFLYDVTKIFLLLVVIVFTVSFIRSFFPPEKTRKMLSH